jgi:hypothetical protein
MKATIIKYSLLLPLILFLIWTGLSLFGCISCFFDVGDDFYCTKYCMASKISVTLILLTYVAFFARAVYVAKQHK